MTIQDRLTQRNTLVIDKEIARAIGVQEAIVLCRIAWWCHHNSLEEAKLKTHYHREKWWTYNTYAAWEKDLRVFGAEYIRKLIGRLEALYFVESDYFSEDPNDQTKWYTINWFVIERFLYQWEEAGYPAPSHPAYKDVMAWLQNWLVDYKRQHAATLSPRPTGKSVPGGAGTIIPEGGGTPVPDIYSKNNQLVVPVQGARIPRALFGELSGVTPGPLRPRGEDERTSWAMSDNSLPDVCKVLWRVFSPSNAKLNVSTKQKGELEAAVTVRGSNESHPSPNAVYALYPKQFEAFLENLRKWMKSKGISVNTGNIIRYVRAYDYKSIGWFEHMPAPARAIKQEESGGMLDALKDIIGD